MSSSRTCRSWATVLLLVTVLACVTLPSAALVSNEAVRTSQTSNTRNEDNAGVSRGRFLRSEVTDDSLEARVLPGLNQVATSKTSWTSRLVQDLKLRMGNKSPDDAFKVLKLDKTGNKLFESARFSKWITVVTKANAKDPEVAMFATLATHYSDDVLANMFAAAKKVDSTKAVATKLEGVQLTNWENAGASADDVFKALNLDVTGTSLFNSPTLSTWTAYVARTHQDNPNEVIFAKLAGGYLDGTLARVIEKATEAASTEKLAKELRSMHFNKWLAQGDNPMTINKMLGATAISDDLTMKIARGYRKFYIIKKKTKAANRVVRSRRQKLENRIP
ncbi:hypothetical protein PHYPSEUDO_002034 [Phytophthora pseudosyringae]|uniref:RxLR effector PexRD54 WY domain-containing protein n=1 Tax=Phytophthora pseudosyringae TaxID=221518 RepID=A0A8T1VUA1_9STRA|nr:hypothetical protein PHYPSEUDO_002034 [Phytophthora pseudosyringae]